MPIFAFVISLFLVLNALGNIPLFVGLLGKYEIKKQRKIIVRELLIALFILLLFNFFGDTVLHLIGITQPIIGIAGGTLLFIIALGMIFPRAKDHAESRHSEPLIVPLATPIVAGPGAIATVMIYAEQIGNSWTLALIILLAWIPTFILLYLCSNIKKFLGPRGLIAFQKLGGMLISLIAVKMICSGLGVLLRETLTSVNVPK